MYGPSHTDTLTLEKMREDLVSLTECYESSTRNGGRGFDDFEAFADHIVNATSADAIEDDPDEEAEERDDADQQPSSSSRGPQVATKLARRLESAGAGGVGYL